MIEIALCSSVCSHGCMIVRYDVYRDAVQTFNICFAPTHPGSSMKDFLVHLCFSLSSLLFGRKLTFCTLKQSVFDGVFSPLCLQESQEVLEEVGWAELALRPREAVEEAEAAASGEVRRSLEGCSPGECPRSGKLETDQVSLDIKSSAA